jgi:hypothetical protein
MPAAKKSNIPAANLALYEKLIATSPRSSAKAQFILTLL